MTSAHMPSKMEGQLETSNGKCAQIEPMRTKTKITHQIVAKRHQGNNSKVTLYPKKEDDGNVYMAFCFELQNQKYFPVVKREMDKANAETVKFKVESLPEPQVSSFDKTFLFRWTETSGEWKSLNSVAEPSCV